MTGGTGDDVEMMTVILLMVKRKMLVMTVTMLRLLMHSRIPKDCFSWLKSNLEQRKHVELYCELFFLTVQPYSNMHKL